MVEDSFELPTAFYAFGRAYCSWSVLQHASRWQRTSFSGDHIQSWNPLEPTMDCPTGMAERITTVSERAVNHYISMALSTSNPTLFNGIGFLRDYLQPDSSIDAATAEVTASCRRFGSRCRRMTPPTFLSYTAANVPVLQLELGGAKFLRAGNSTTSDTEGVEPTYSYGNGQLSRRIYSITLR